MGLALPMQDYFERIECYCCGVLFWISASLQRNLKENKQSFYCPNGHSQAYLRSEADRLREALAQAQKDKALETAKFWEAEERSRKLQAKLNRVNRGVCPHCRRSFQNLKRHIECKHKQAVAQ